MYRVGKMLLLSCLEAAPFPAARGRRQLSPLWESQVQLEGSGRHSEKWCLTDNWQVTSIDKGGVFPPFLLLAFPFIFYYLNLNNNNNNKEEKERESSRKKAALWREISRHMRLWLKMSRCQSPKLQRTFLVIHSQARELRPDTKINSDSMKYLDRDPEFGSPAWNTVNLCICEKFTLLQMLTQELGHHMDRV